MCTLFATYTKYRYSVTLIIRTRWEQSNVGTSLTTIHSKSPTYAFSENRMIDYITEKIKYYYKEFNVKVIMLISEFTWNSRVATVIAKINFIEKLFELYILQ